MMKFLPVQLADIHAVAAIHRLSFRPGPFYRSISGTASDEALDATMAKRVECYLSLPNMRVWKVVDEGEGGEIMGWAWWTVPYDGPPVTVPRRTMPPGANLELANDFFIKVEELSKSRGRCYELEVLAIHPNHQRKGVGKVLMEWGFKEADKAQLPVYLDATAAGIPMYKALGFVQDGQPHVANDGSFEILPMKRLPTPPSTPKSA
ncbi:acyl-CoA N-acyltransferase [Meredithblackwellia eburnea MCA 4105]